MATPDEILKAAKDLVGMIQKSDADFEVLVEVVSLLTADERFCDALRWHYGPDQESVDAEISVLRTTVRNLNARLTLQQKKAQRGPKPNREKVAKAVQMQAEGVKLQVIANRLGFKKPAAVSMAIRRHKQYLELEESLKELEKTIEETSKAASLFEWLT